MNGLILLDAQICVFVFYPLDGNIVNILISIGMKPRYGGIWIWYKTSENDFHVELNLCL